MYETSSLIKINEIWYDDLDTMYWGTLNGTMDNNIRGFFRGGTTYRLTHNFTINISNTEMIQLNTMDATVKLSFKLYVLCTWDYEFAKVDINNQNIWQSVSFYFVTFNASIPMPYNWQAACNCRGIGDTYRVYETRNFDVRFNATYNQPIKGF